MRETARDLRIFIPVVGSADFFPSLTWISSSSSFSAGVVFLPKKEANLSVKGVFLVDEDFLSSSSFSAGVVFLPKKEANLSIKGVFLVDKDSPSSISGVVCLSRKEANLSICVFIFLLGKSP